MLLCKFTLCFRLKNRCWSNIEFLFPCVILNLHLQRVCNQMRFAADKLSINSSGREARRLLLRRWLSHNHRRLKQGALNAAIMGNICWLNHHFVHRNAEMPPAHGRKSVVKHLLKIYRRDLRRPSLPLMFPRARLHDELYDESEAVMLPCLTAK